MLYLFLLYYCVGTTLCFPSPNRVTGDPDSDHLVVKKVDDSHNLWYKSSDRLEDSEKKDVITNDGAIVAKDNDATVEEDEDVGVDNSDNDAIAYAEGEDGIAVDNSDDDVDNSDGDAVGDDDSEDDPLVVQFPEGDHFMLIPKVRVDIGD